nr:transposase (putative), gypsy type [Tanacetum cinerariifolium]
MSSIDDIKSILTQSGLDALCEKFHIPLHVHPELPGRNIRIRNSPTSKIGVYTSCLSLRPLRSLILRSCAASMVLFQPWAIFVEMDLFAFINHVDPTKVRIGEREVAEGEDEGVHAVNEESGDDAVVDQTKKSDHVVYIGGIDIVADDEAQTIVVDKPKKVRKKRKAAGGSGLPPKKLKEDYGTSGIGASTSGKFVDALQSLLEGCTLTVEVGVTVEATLPFITSSVSLMPEHEGGGHTDSVTRPNLRTQRAAERFVVLSDSSHHYSTNDADDEVTYVIRAGIEPVPRGIFRDSASTSEANQDIAGPSHPVAARQTCLSSMVRLRLEHELRGRRKFKDKCAMQAGWLKERDVNITNLKAQLSLKEAKAAEAICLRGQIATVEAAKATRASELEGLKEQNAALDGQAAALESTVLSCDELSIKASSLEFQKDKLVYQVSKLEDTCSELRDEVSGYKLFKEQIEVVHDVQVKVLSDRVAELDANLMRMALHLDEEFYPCFFDYHSWSKGGLAAGIDHGKVGRGLTDVATYDPFAEANYISTMSAFRAVNFPILAQLKSYKDANIADIMGLLHLEVGEASTSEVLVTAATTALSTTFIHASIVLPISVVDHDASGAGLSTKVPSPSKIVFENEVLETTPKHTAAS